jgi:hypothetical protein
MFSMMRPTHTLINATTLWLATGLSCLACSSGTPAARTAEVAPAAERAPDTPENHRAAAERLLTQLKLQALIDATLEAMLDAQISTNPQLQAFRPEMEQFMGKYLSWTALKEDFVRIYMDAYTQRELEDVLAFYSTPTGQKTIELMPALARKGAEIGQRRVQEHLPELKEMVVKRSLEMPQPNGPTQ